MSHTFCIRNSLVKGIGMFFAWLCVATVASAASSAQFPIRVLTGEDTVPPSVPADLAATATAQTQIDVSWSASTDNFSLAGYVLWRDGVPLATTTALSFFDTGLTASTTYTYTIQAFDSAGNYSATSTPVATTTLAVPPPPPTTTPATTSPSESGGTFARAELEQSRVIAAERSVAFEFEASRPVRYLVQWGETATYELGYSLSDAYRRVFTTTIADLAPGTSYYFKITALLPNNRSQVIFAERVTTKAEDEALLIPNVRGLRATVEGDDVVLAWDNPALPGLMVRVLRSPYQFPLTPTDGRLVYQGDGESIRDTRALALEPVQYYSVFTQDSEGNFSTGVLTVVRQAVGDGVSAPEPPSATTSQIETPTVVYRRPETRLPTLEEITLQQLQRSYAFADRRVELSADRSFVVRIPAERVASHLKSIVLSLRPVSGAASWEQYLLRRNESGTAYVGYIAPRQFAADYQVALHIYDFEAQVAGEYRTVWRFVSGAPQPPLVTAGTETLWWIGWYAPYLLLFPLVWFLFLLARRVLEAVRINRPFAS